jgi:hypothetical protein
MSEETKKDDGHKGGVYREPVQGHTVKYPADGTGAPPPGYEYLCSIEDFRAGKVPEFKPARTAEELFDRRPQPEETQVVSGQSVKRQASGPDKARAKPGEDK